MLDSRWCEGNATLTSRTGDDGPKTRRPEQRDQLSVNRISDNTFENNGHNPNLQLSGHPSVWADAARLTSR